MTYTHFMLQKRINVEKGVQKSMGALWRHCNYFCTFFVNAASLREDPYNYGAHIQELFIMAKYNNSWCKSWIDITLNYKFDMLF